MFRPTNFPLLVFGLSLVVLWGAVQVGVRSAHRLEDVREDFGIVVTATLTLLSLILGFTFTMAVGRYDQRKLYEEEEANTIGTEYVRADLLPSSDAENVRRRLREYLDLRIRYYQTQDRTALRQIDISTGQLQKQLWAAVRTASAAQQTPVLALAVSGMNDVLNSQSYTQAAWLNRIPPAAWALVAIISLAANGMVGALWRRGRSMGLLSGILPLIVSLSLVLIADIDSPRGGLIPVRPVGLISLAASLRP
ncbi:MAG TPA: hypothetical protein VMB21_10825 [Candidatus Limnocylindria bacterium]|nr:hypothetical protein [Candidatus Limnocylindria bacterium]